MPTLDLEARDASLDFFPDLLTLDLEPPDRWLRADAPLADEEPERILAEDPELPDDDIERIEPRVPCDVPDLLSLPELVVLENTYPTPAIRPHANPRAS
jgi:hypothetical protein